MQVTFIREIVGRKLILLETHNMLVMTSSLNKDRSSLCPTSSKLVSQELETAKVRMRMETTSCGN